MTKCELCKNTARVYCESDEARLCWSCDAKVHAANFLVARHVRKLLCHSCQSPTAWSGSGKKLGRTISICESCVVSVKYGDEKVESEGISSSQFPPPVSCSSSEDRSQIDINVSPKRSRDFLIDLNSKDDDDSSCIAGEENSYAAHVSSLRPLKFRKLEVNETAAGRPQVASTGTRIAEAAARRIRQHVDMNKRMIVDFDLNERPCEKHK